MHSSRYSCSRSFVATGNHIPSIFIGIYIYSLCITSVLAMDFNGQNLSNVDMEERKRSVDELLEKINVLPEDKKLQYRKDLEEFANERDAMTSNGKKTVKRLRAIADRLDQVWWDYKMRIAAGTAACVVGGVMTYNSRRAIALGFGVAGVVVNLEALSKYSSHNSEIKEADELLKETADNCNVVRRMIQDWSVEKETIRLFYIYGLAKGYEKTSPQVLKVLRELVLDSMRIPVESGTITLLENVAFHLGGATAAFQSGAEGAAKIGAQVTDDILQAGAETSAKEGSKAGAQANNNLVNEVSKIVGILPENIFVFANTVFLVKDVIDLSFTVNDLVQNRGHDGAKVLREKAKEIEDALKL